MKYKINDVLYYDGNAFYHIVQIIGISVETNTYKGRVIANPNSRTSMPVGYEYETDIDEVDEAPFIKIWSSDSDVVKTTSSQITFDREAPSADYSDAFDLIKHMF